MPRIVADIDYANFKDEVALATGWQGLSWPEKNLVGKPGAFGGLVVDPAGRLSSFVVAAFMGTAALGFADVSLQSFKQSK